MFIRAAARSAGLARTVVVRLKKEFPVPPRAVSTRKAPSPRKPKAIAAAPTVTPDDISRRAYEIYESHRGAEGSPLDDWLRAERELSDSVSA